MKVFQVIAEDGDVEGAARAPTAVPEDDEVDEDVSSYSCDNLGKSVPQSSGVMVADAAAAGPLLGVLGAGGRGRGGTKPTCTLVRVSTYASSLNQPMNR
jgi:hypothetical protein